MRQLHSREQAVQSQPVDDRSVAAGPVPRRRLLIVDGEFESATALQRMVTEHGYDARCVHDADAVSDACQVFEPDLAILDLDMTSPAAIRLILFLVDSEKLPFVVYSKSSESFNRITALRVGADNYLQKPMDDLLILAYIEATFRRIERADKLILRDIYKQWGPYRINRINRNVQYQGRTVRLSGTEYELFCVLASRFGEVVDRRALTAALELSDDEILGRALDQRVFRLRNRLDAAGAPKDAIKSVRAKGFVLTAGSSHAVNH